MGHISEPKNVDLIIESPPLSDNERKEISQFIKKLKKKRASKSIKKNKRIEKDTTP